MHVSYVAMFAQVGRVQVDRLVAITWRFTMLFQRNVTFAPRHGSEKYVLSDLHYGNQSSQRIYHDTNTITNDVNDDA